MSDFFERRNVMLQMKNMSFVMGIKLRIYPTNEQKSIIAINAGAARFVYNRLVARNKELFLLRKTGCFVEPIANPPIAEFEPR